MADKLVAIGDIHGCPRSAEALLKKLEPYHSVPFVFIGDYIDRGPDSRAVIDLLIDFSRDRDCIMLRGNHEQMMIDALATGDSGLWMYNGGKATLSSYGALSTKPGLPSAHHHFIHNTELYHESEEYFFVHAGLPADITVKQAVDNEHVWPEFLWQRSHIDARKPVWEKKVVFGHTPVSEPIHNEFMLGIDTGCVFKNLPGLGYLTAAILPEEEFITQQCLDNPQPY